MSELRILGYVRVSTDRQADEGLGLEVQEEAIRSWCSTRNFELLLIHRDEGLSGSLDPGDRPGLAAAGWPDACADRGKACGGEPRGTAPIRGAGQRGRS